MRRGRFERAIGGMSFHLLAVPIVSLMLLSTGTALLGRPPGPALSAPTDSAPLHAALLSLESGSAPPGAVNPLCVSVDGAPNACRGPAPSVASIDRQNGVPQPRAAPILPGATTRTPPPSAGGMSMTYDAADRYVLLYVPAVAGKHPAQTW
ncbi:MAG TPA: hypothetical protein VIZ68_01115, partial [Thermoplasmata archaeon]